jgi:endonuclease YncB( thermonuclease family)
MAGRPRLRLAVRERVDARRDGSPRGGSVHRYGRANAPRRRRLLPLALPLLAVCLGGGSALAISPNSPSATSHLVPIRDNGPAGRVVVVDGDSIEVNGQPVRLWGIDAAELSQTCTLDGRPWACGRDAAQVLARKLAGRVVACETRTRDQYGRIVALCRADREDISAWLVEQGWALAFRRFSLDYVAHEDRARAARRGIWAGSFQPPWEWRADGRRRAPR